MRTFVLTISVLLFLTISSHADYTYVIEDGYFQGLILNDEETLLMTGGGA